MPPGAISEATEPTTTPPEIEPPLTPLARVPPLSVTAAAAGGRAVLPLDATRMPPLTVVPPV